MSEQVLVSLPLDLARRLPANLSMAESRLAEMLVKAKEESVAETLRAAVSQVPKDRQAINRAIAAALSASPATPPQSEEARKLALALAARNAGVTAFEHAQGYMSGNTHFVASAPVDGGRQGRRNVAYGPTEEDALAAAAEALGLQPVYATPANVAPPAAGEGPRCADCGTPLNEGEAKTFTVCDACWDRQYGKAPAAAEGLYTAQRVEALLRQVCSESYKGMPPDYQDKYRDIIDTIFRRALLTLSAPTNTPAADGPTKPAPAVVERREDMGQGFLRLVRQPDGDVAMAINGRSLSGPIRMASIEFCSVADGGGKSPETVAALRALHAAMHADNLARPQAPTNTPGDQQKGT